MSAAQVMNWPPVQKKKQKKALGTVESPSSPEDRGGEESFQSLNPAHARSSPSAFWSAPLADAAKVWGGMTAQSSAHLLTESESL